MMPPQQQQQQGWQDIYIPPYRSRLSRYDLARLRLDDNLQYLTKREFLRIHETFRHAEERRFATLLDGLRLYQTDPRLAHTLEAKFQKRLQKQIYDKLMTIIESKKARQEEIRQRAQAKREALSMYDRTPPTHRRRRTSSASSQQQLMRTRPRRQRMGVTEGDTSPSPSPPTPRRRLAFDQLD